MTRGSALLREGLFGRPAQANQPDRLGSWIPDRASDSLALVVLAGFFVARLVFAFAFGLGIDESYTLAISRRLSLSYFDHPPLHVWLAHFSALALGETVAARIPFIALFSVTSWIFYRLCLRTVWPSGRAHRTLCPQCYAFFLRVRRKLDCARWPSAIWVGDRRAGGGSPVFLETPVDEVLAWRLWLLIGLGLGLAGLSKSAPS